MPGRGFNPSPSALNSSALPAVSDKVADISFKNKRELNN